MIEFEKLQECEKKLRSVCAENNLLYELDTNSYPVTLTIQPNGKALQPVLFKLPEDEHTDPQAFIRFAMQSGELTYKFSRTFIINDALLAKIKGLFKNIYYAWLEEFFRQAQEKQLFVLAADNKLQVPGAKEQ